MEGDQADKMPVVENEGEPPKVEDEKLLVENDVNSKLQRRILNAFEPFDVDENQTVDVREVGTIIRSLGVYPTEAQLHELIKEIEEEEPAAFIRYEKFEKMMIRVISTEEIPRDTEDKILAAFHVLDPEKKGYLEPDELKVLISTNGERFSSEEVEEMLSYCVDPTTGVINYEQYAANLALSGHEND